MNHKFFEMKNLLCIFKMIALTGHNLYFAAYYNLKSLLKFTYDNLMEIAYLIETTRSSEYMSHLMCLSLQSIRIRDVTEITA